VHRFHVLMTEPTLQGFARHDLTRFIVIPGPKDSPRIHDANGDIPSPPDSESTSAPPSESDVETLEIDENFLASGLIDSMPQGTEQITANGSSNDVTHESHRLRSPTSPDSRRPMASSSLVFQAVPLSAPIPYSPETLDAECCVFLRSSDLSRVGMFNGDWVRLHGHKPFAMRRFTTLFDSFRG
jgi:peroxin-6